MDVIFRGTRGSVPTPGQETIQYGGNTTCVQVTTAKREAVVLDAGTGIRSVQVPSGIPVTILLSHLHWDHIQGLPFAGILFDPTRDVTIMGPRPSGDMSLRQALEAQMQPPHFPISMNKLPANIKIKEIVREDLPFKVGSVTVTAHRLNHPGVTYGYRIEEPATKQVVVFAPDNELGLTSEIDRAMLAHWARGADLLIHDSQYTDQELPSRKTWGHSSYEEALALAHMAGVERLAFFHHDPARTDRVLTAIVDQTMGEDSKRHPKRDLVAFAAQEGAVALEGPDTKAREISELAQ